MGYYGDTIMISWPITLLRFPTTLPKSDIIKFCDDGEVALILIFYCNVIHVYGTLRLLSAPQIDNLKASNTA